MPKQCRYVKKFKGFLVPHFPYCACKAPGNSARTRYGKTDEGYPIMGCGNPPDGWYRVCVLGKDDSDGTTPSKCKFYR